VQGHGVALTGGAHRTHTHTQRERESKRTEGWADERGSRISERGDARVREVGTGSSVPSVSERERGECAGAGWCRQVGTTCQREAGARGA
jgi:hypothetical protein